MCAISADAQTLNGAGTSFPYPVYSQWAYKYNSLTGVRINYQSIGSGGGIAQINAKTVDFGASDAPLTAEELDKAKNMLEADFVRSMATVNGKAGKIGRYEILFGDYREILNVPGRYRGVTSEDIKRVVQEFLTVKGKYFCLF